MLSRSTRHRVAAFAITSSLAAVTLLVPATSFAAAPAAAPAANPPPPPAPKDARPEPAEDVREEKPTSLSVAAAPMLPVGDLSNAVGFGLGGLIGVDHAFHAHGAFVARTGYIHHLPRSGVAMTLGALPIWAGARYRFKGLEGPYVEALLGPTVLFATVDVGRFGRQSDSEVKLGTTLGGGYRVGQFDAGVKLAFYDIGHAGDTMGVIGTVGWAFAAF